MRALLTFANVAFAQIDADEVRVKKGQTFTMFLDASPNDGLQWSTTKDEVLSVKETDAVTATITTTKAGTSKVILLDQALNKVFYLTFFVDDPDEAATFDVPTPTTEPIT